MFGGLHQAKMALWQHQIAAPGQGTQDGESGGRHAQPRQPFVPGAGDAVQDHARKRQVRTVAGKPQRHGGGGLRLTAHVDHQHHRPAHAGRHFGAGPGAAGPGQGHAVIQPHRPFGDADVRPGGLGRNRVQQAIAHRPGIKIERRPPGGRAVKGGVDVIRPAFERLHGQTIVAKRPQQPQHDRGLAGARGRGRDHQAGRQISHRIVRARHWGGTFGRNLWNTGGFRRSLRRQGRDRQGSARCVPRRRPLRSR